MTLEVLCIEDDPRDFELVEEAFRGSGIEAHLRRVERRDEFEVALTAGRVDLVISDFRLPAFDALEALEIVRRSAPELPFILVTGSLGEDFAIDMMRAGVSDFVVKEHLQRLGPAALRALREATLRRERRELEEQLRHAQRMEAIGNLAGGIAHEFNNGLTAIIGHASLAQGTVDPDHPCAEHLRHVLQAAAHATDVAARLLAFARRQLHRPEKIALNATVRSTEALLRGLVSERIRIELALADTDRSVYVDPVQLRQVLVNLIANARDAMPDGGRIRIATGITPEVAGPDDKKRFATIVVADEGAGMNEETRKRCFEPFFTTKPQGHGTGLGLSVTYGIVTQAGGRIDVASRPGAGTTFTISLPVVDSTDATPAAVRQTGSFQAPIGPVLIVEDDVLVRQVVVTALNRIGCETVVRGSTRDAMGYVSASHNRIGVVVTDVGLPDLPVSDLLAAIARYRPEVPVIVISGYASDDLVRTWSRKLAIDFLPKPFTPASLCEAVSLAVRGRFQAEAPG